MGNNTFYFKNLDALRFWAFLGIFLSHTITLSEGPQYQQPVSDFISEMLVFYLGVPFFFTLSSFLITYKILDEYSKSGKMNLFNFYLKRGLRIWPIYYLLLLFCFVLMPLIFSALKINAVLPPAIPFLFFWENFYMIHHGIHFLFPLIVLWSIAIEEQFYIFWGLILKVFKKFLLFFILLFLFSSIAFCYYYLYTRNQPTFNLKLHSFYGVPSFCLGALMAFICHTKNRAFYFFERLPPLFYFGIYFFIAGFYILQKLQITSFDIIVSVIINSTCYALILFDQTFNKKRVFNAGKISIINYLGKISYGLYIFHELIILFTIKVLHFYNIGKSFAVTAFHTIITLAITLFAAHISFKYFEKYFLTLKDKL